MSKTKEKLRYSRGNWLQYRVIRLLLSGLLLLPYEKRIPLSGWLMSRVTAPIAGYRSRIRDNLRLIVPEMPEDEVERLCRAVPDNFGRAFIEFFSGTDFTRYVREHHKIYGPGLPAIAEASAAGRPVVFVTGHFGNYDASRVALAQLGYQIGALYRPMNNGWFNDHYVSSILKIGKPMFPRGKKGLGEMVRFLRKGGMIALVIDQHMSNGARLRYFGQDALTSLSATEVALKYDALCVPAYAIRQPNGLDFEVLIEAPIPHGPAEEMTQALNDSLESQVRQHMDQWFWIHRRWKVLNRR